MVPVVIAAEMSGPIRHRRDEKKTAPIGDPTGAVSTRGEMLYALSLLVILATCSPWKRAIFNSFSLGLRLPSVPAKVVAP